MPFFRSWSPLREMEDLRRNIDDLLEHLRGRIGYPSGAGSSIHKPPLEAFVEEGKLIVRAELPAVDAKDISVNVLGDTLIIRASRQEDQETKKRDFVHREFTYGAIERSIPLPTGVKAEDIKASFNNGLLQLTISLPEETAPKEIKVNVEHGGSGPEGAKSA